MKMSIGFDISKETVDAAFFNGKTMEHIQVENSKKGFSQIWNRCKGFDSHDLIFTMEATGVYHECCAEYFHDKGSMVSVVNPLIIKRYADMKMLRAKTDKVDAKLIAQYGFSETGFEYKRKSETSLKIKAFLKVIDALQRTRTQNGNRLEALRHHAMRMPEVEAVYCKINREISEQITHVEKEILLLEKKEFAGELNNLLSIPGVGKRTASAIIGFFERMDDFGSAKQLISFIGINPSPRTSGTSVRGHGSISKKGNAYLRKLLYLAALSASKHNRSCSDLYFRLVAKGKSKKLALVAVANKLARQIFAVVRYNRGYDPNFSATI
jgi:transposase